MASHYRRTSAAVMALAMLFAAGACSSESSGSDSGAASSDVGNSTAAPSSDAPAEPSSTEASVAEAPSSEAPVAELDCDADQQAGIDAESMSRSVTVLFSADSKSGVSSADITAETTMTIQDDGTLSPATLTVAVGQVFGIMPAAGASLDAVKIGCADAQTLLPGSPAGFVITAPGTYLISLDIAGTELGTVTVQ